MHVNLTLSCACPGRLEVSRGIVEAKHVTLERHSIFQQLVLQEAQKEVRHEKFYTVHRRDKSTMKVCRCALRMMKLPCKAAKSTVHSVEEETFNVH